MAIVYDPTSDSYFDDGSGDGQETSLPEYELGSIDSGYNPNTSPSSGESRTEVTPAPAITTEEAIATSGETTGISGFNASGVWVGTSVSPGYNPNASPSSGAARTVENSAPTTTSSFFSELTDSFLKDVKKNPTSYLKIGLDGYAAANTSKNAKEAAALNRQSAIDQQNNAQALQDAKNAKYNASFNFSKQPASPRKQTPLTRTDGRRVYDQNGNIAR